MRPQLFLLPGFLGEGKDFDPFMADLAKLDPDLHVQALDWFETASHLLQENFETLGAALAEELEKRAEAGRPLYVLGYSLGGRMALALMDYWRQSPRIQSAYFIFVSANPGLQNAQEREQRLRSDSQWAGRFRSEDWPTLMRDWNAQGVFKDSRQEPERPQRKSQRDLLAKCLMQWSLAKQPDYRAMLQVASNYLWITGGKDEKFTRLAVGLNNSKTIPAASHRVHLDSPIQLAEMVYQEIEATSI
jgi:2-succinyl-6-hydroxy-2,4-cyclohexadiene-1-carboxylate synthase